MVESKLGDGLLGTQNCVERRVSHLAKLINKKVSRGQKKVKLVLAGSSGSRSITRPLKNFWKFCRDPYKHVLVTLKKKQSLKCGLSHIKKALICTLTASVTQPTVITDLT